MATGRRVRTYSFWPEDQAGKYQEAGTDLTVDFKTDFDHLQDLISGVSISDRGHTIRKMRLSVNEAEWLMKEGYHRAGCKDYWGAAGGLLSSDDCNCMDYSTRLWYSLTGNREDFRIRVNDGRWWIPGGPLFYGYWPDALAETLEKKNKQYGDFFQR